MSVDFDSLARGYSVFWVGLKPVLRTYDEVIDLESAQLKVTKGLKKLKTDVEKSTIPEEEKKRLSTKIDGLSEAAKGIPLFLLENCWTM